ncbi:Las1-like-domain-containing protein [Ampelomyces quisqualis]|uniref:Las1-like-domain-containing protein n=1 Tax=Ampelomyces quisqualis TaxID=50730 RepID=A0A6A5R130_AMPQU|nr:Las1-like-domain-containing protein [Ampelomyces quisqualis]
MDQPDTQFVVTPWRTSKELLQLRHDLYASDTPKKERAVSKVFAWRLRKPDGLPLLLDSTADIVDVLLQDAKNELTHNPLRLLYATALSRFITGLADTQIDLIRDKPSWFPPGKTLQLPYPLLEIRHRIVHRHLPSLAELKRAAQDSLDWLWEWYWAQLDHAFGPSQPTNSDDAAAALEGTEVVHEKLHSTLKTYVKERKNEIKSHRKDSKAAESALSTYTLRFSPATSSLPSHRTTNILLNLLVSEKMILPADKKFGSSMSGAFIIWDPVLLALCTAGMVSVSRLLGSLTAAMNAPANASTTMNIDVDPARQGWCEWITHILCAETWAAHQDALVERVLAECFSDPVYWNVKVAERLLEDGRVAREKEGWLAVLMAAKGEGMHVHVDVDVQGEVATQVKKPKEKIRGPTKVVGMWKARPIGWMAEEWDEDE